MEKAWRWLKATCKENISLLQAQVDRVNGDISQLENPETYLAVFTSSRNVLSLLQLRNETERLEHMQKGNIEVMC